MQRALPTKNLPPALSRYLELLYVLTLRNLKVRYRGSILGVYWSLLNPLIMTGVYTAIFGKTFSVYYDGSLINYLLAAFTGLVVINFFNVTTTQALNSVVSNGGLLNKIRLPMSVLPLSLVFANIFQFAVGSLPLLMLITLVASGHPLNALLLLIPAFALILVATGVSLVVSALYVFFRDLPYLYELVTFALLLSSPVFYPSAIIPDAVRPFLALNPLSPIIEGLRQLLLGHGSLDWGQLGVGLLSGVVVCCAGALIFRARSEEFMDLL